MAFLLVCWLICLTSEGIRRSDGSEEWSSKPAKPFVKNAIQKAWAAQAMINLEHRKCERQKKYKRPWQKCPRKWDATSFGCWETCGKERNLPQLPVNCTRYYCVKTQSDCFWKLLRIGLSWAKVAINLVVNIEALDNIKDVLEGTSDLLTAEALLEGVMQPTIQNILKRTGRTVMGYMARSNYTMPTKEAIIQGGAEIVALSAAAALKEYMKDVSAKLLRALDFTGISKAIHSFDGGEPCKDIKVTPMPKKGVVKESVSHKLGARMYSYAV
eukprot:TRINITY_DN25096_c0_g3_i1.p1 TRINITY_DN25096_c0_g3~~TRINITY_DN25096_c0_g3_i1.p1  ORF type:complete len:282 (-),score=38.51 TRINITY_DN25096_c0_g3_i1:193-1005(-)